MGFDMMIMDNQIALGQVSHGSLPVRKAGSEWIGPWCDTQLVKERPHLLLEVMPLSWGVYHRPEQHSG